MIILSIDSAGGGCGVCVWRDGHVLESSNEPMERGQDQRLMPLILEVMKKADVAFDALDRIAVTRGPGSFTGLRIGLAAARGIGLASDKPVIGIDRFSIFREQIGSGKSLLVIIDSRRKEFFCRFYPAKGSAFEPSMMTKEEIMDFLAAQPGTIVTGDAFIADLPGFHKTAMPESVTAAALASQATPGASEYQPQPLYLRAPDVTIPKQRDSV